MDSPVTRKSLFWYFDAVLNFLYSKMSISSPLGFNLLMIQEIPFLPGIVDAVLYVVFMVKAHLTTDVMKSNKQF